MQGCYSILVLLKQRIDFSRLFNFIFTFIFAKYYFLGDYFEDDGDEYNNKM